MELRHSHVGICVSDAALSTRFYVEGLGFEFVSSYEMHGPEIGRLLGFDSLEMRGSFVKRGDLVLELLEFKPPNAPRPGTIEPMNRPGLTHLAFEVDDVYEVQARIGEFGGSARDHTRIQTTSENRGDKDTNDLIDGTVSVMCTDPDGIRIELLKSPGSPVGHLGTRLCWQLS
jgi:catechol 2,3-dioxygenase-like lactoylglutathione lyase family enzyme